MSGGAQCRALLSTDSIDARLRGSHTETVDVHLTPEQENYLRQSVQNGRFATTEQALGTAIALLQRQELQGSSTPPSPQTKSLARLFAESPLKGLDLNFPREKDQLRLVEP